jgi:hypothetical protein
VLHYEGNYWPAREIFAQAPQKHAIPRNLSLNFVLAGLCELSYINWPLAIRSFQ